MGFPHFWSGLVCQYFHFVLKLGIPPFVLLTFLPWTTAEPVRLAEVESEVLIAEVQLVGLEGRGDTEQLQDTVYAVLKTKPGQVTSRSQLQADLAAIGKTGYFAQTSLRLEDTPLGVRVTFTIQPNPRLKTVATMGATLIPDSVLQQIFAGQYGQTLNQNQLQASIKRINHWYQEEGYVLAQVVDAIPKEEGRLELVIAEGIIDSIQIRFMDAEGKTHDQQGQPIQGRTQPHVILRELALKPGDILQRDRIQADQRRVFQLGLFEDIQLRLEPAEANPQRVTAIYHLIESKYTSLDPIGGYSPGDGFFGATNVTLANLGGKNQELQSNVTLSQRSLLFDISFSDPWIQGDPYRTSYQMNAFRRRTSPLVFSGGATDVDLPNGDTPRLNRSGGQIQFTRPLSQETLKPAEWTATAGLEYARVAVVDRDGDRQPRDELGNALTFSGREVDDLLLLQLGLTRNKRNSNITPTQGSLTRLNFAQSVPVGNGNILMNRLQVSHSQYLPVHWLRLTPGCRNARDRGLFDNSDRTTNCPQTLAFNLKAGTILGDLPPYEAFSLGGANSIRGYDNGEVASGRSFVQTTAEYRFPLLSFLGGVLFADWGSDLGSGKGVPGNPAGIRGKPGNAYGAGLGLRIQTPILGTLRLDYAALSDDGNVRFQFGIGERF